jgi:Zn-dependent protease with chaperone function
MRILFLVSLLFFSSAAWSEDIISVLERSAMQRMAAQTAVDHASPQAKLIKATFDQLNEFVHLENSVEIKVVTGPLNAEAILGKYIVASEVLAELPESERTFLLAHEMGHVTLGHWSQLTQLYIKHIPGEVTSEATSSVEKVLGIEAHQQAYRQEFEADAFAFKLIKKMGIGLDSAIATLMRNPSLGDASHPSMHKRILQLRMLEADSLKH